MLVYCLSPYTYLQTALCTTNGWSVGEMEAKAFPDGERYHRLLTDPNDRDCLLIGSTYDDTLTLDLYDLASAIAGYGARSLTILLPYYAYSTMERAVLSGEVVKAKTRARLLSSLPRPGRGLHILLLDLHSEGIPHYFENGLHAVHLYAKPVVLAAIRQAGGEDFVLASTDAGRAKWVESLAADLGVTPAFVYKQRISGSETRLTGVNADVAGKQVVIYDDMVRTGGSLLRAAEAYHQAGASGVAAVATHILCPGDALSRLAAAGTLQALHGTNSLPRAVALANQTDFLRLHDIAGVFGSYLQTMQ